MNTDSISMILIFFKVISHLESLQVSKTYTKYKKDFYYIRYPIFKSDLFYNMNHMGIECSSLILSQK